MKHVFLVHWKADEVDSYAAPLRDAGWRVEVETDDGSRVARRMRDDPPDVVAISLRRRPSHGRAAAAHLREVTSLQDVPIVFFDGDGDESARALQEVADAVHVTWEDLPRVLEEIAEP